MFKLCLFMPVMCCALLCADIIDRIAISVANQAITDSQIDEEVRATQFLNGDKLDVSAAERKQAADRLIEQALVKREMEQSRYPLPALSEGNEQLQMMKAGYPNDAQFQEALQAYGITQDELSRRLWWQLTILRFVDYRFRPGIQVSDAEVQAYYKKQVAKWEEEGSKSIPTLQEARGQIAEILTQQKIDEALDSWLAGERMQIMIEYHDKALQ